MIKSYKVDIFVFLFLFIILSLISIFILQSPDWDFYNYHYYNGWAFLNDRVGTDFLPANFRTYINPYYDSFLYFLMTKLNNHPYIFLSLSSFDNALFLYLIYKIANFIITEQNKLIKSIILFLVIAYTAFSPIMLDALNCSMNDVAAGNFVLITLYLLIRNLFNTSKHRNKLIILSGIILGAGICIKYSCAIALGGFIAIFIFQRKQIENFGKTFILFFSSVFISFILTDGYWLLLLFKLYGNPIYPYLNDIFKSPFFDIMNIASIDYLDTLPRNIFEFIFYPFMYSKDFFFGNYHLDWDARYAINFICVLILSLNLLFKKNKTDLYLGIIKYEHIWFIILFVFFTYYINTYFTGVYRFIIPSSALYGITFFISIFLLCNLIKIKNIKHCILISTFILILVYLNNTYNSDYKIVMPQKDNAKLFYNNEDYKFEDNSKIILLNCPISYLAASQNKNAKYYGFVIPSHIFEKHKKYMEEEEKPAFHTRYMFSKYIEKTLSDTLVNPDNKIYLIYDEYPYYEDVYKQALDFYSNNTREMQNCREIGYQGIIYFDYIQSYLCEFNLKE